MRVERVSNAVLVAALLAWAASWVPVYLWLFRSPDVYAITVATRGLVTSTLFAYAVAAAMIAPIFWIGRQTPARVGLRARDLPLGLAVLGLAYVLLQASLVIAALIGGDGVHAGRALLADPGAVAGDAIAQLFGTTLVEEVLFRGFLLRQLMLRMPRPRAFVVSALVFALSHVPNRLWLGLAPLDWIPDFTGLFGGGLILAWIYVRTENIFLCIALHALWNEPAPLVAVPFPAQWMLVVPAVALAAWICATPAEPTGRRRLL